MLVVDDEDALARLASRYLRDEGFEVFTAHDGEEGLVRARELKPDVIVTDASMPKMDGWAMAKELKADAELHEIPLVFLTAMNDAKSLARGIGAGARHWLPKPIDGDKLVETVRRALKNAPKAQVR